MVATSSRILSCGGWLMLMRKMSAPASNRRRIIALSEDAGASVARILIRRSRLISFFRGLAGGLHPAALHPVNSAGPERRRGRPFPEYPERAAAVPAARWHR